MVEPHDINISVISGTTVNDLVNLLSHITKALNNFSPHMSNEQGIWQKIFMAWKIWVFRKKKKLFVVYFRQSF